MLVSREASVEEQVSYSCACPCGRIAAVAPGIKALFPYQVSVLVGKHRPAAQVVFQHIGDVLRIGHLLHHRKHAQRAAQVGTIHVTIRQSMYLLAIPEICSSVSHHKLVLSAKIMDLYVVAQVFRIVNADISFWRICKSARTGGQAVHLVVLEGLLQVAKVVLSAG